MKNLALALVAAVAISSQATVIQFAYLNDNQQIVDQTANDLFYTGLVNAVQYNNGSISLSDALVGKYAVIDVTDNKFYISTSNVPADLASTAVFSGTFGSDITAADVANGASAYTLGGVSIDNSISSQALSEFQIALNMSPNADYTYSASTGLGSGQVTSVPEPTTMGLMGLGLMGLAFAARRKKFA